MQANKTTTTTHNTTCVQAMCCPRHPTACQHTQNHVCRNWSHTRATQSRSIQPCRCASTRNLYKTNKWQSHLRRHQPPTHNRGHNNKKLLRKEVIQPHLPVRLPCYDFVPIADPTFDSSHDRPLASGVTNFHDVTGGVYKARERIHRSVADLRLLATPTSWGRVADPNPN